ncbi:hypothetical protein N7486_000197 [Penicillium sp. IBT 16267x]|nr:hypothetical protein N7486_000197 [Penicillium sp. IBT 16267x]
MGIPTMGMKTTDMKVLCYSRISSAKRTVPFPQGILINLSDTCEEPVPEGILIDLSNSSDVPIQGVDPKGLSDELDTLVTEVEDLIDLSDKSDASKTPPMEAVALRSPSPSTPSNNVIRGSSSSRVTSTSSTQPPRGDLPDLANLVHLATNRQKEVLFLMHEPRRLAPAHMGGTKFDDAAESIFTEDNG